MYLNKHQPLQTPLCLTSTWCFHHCIIEAWHVSLETAPPFKSFILILQTAVKNLTATVALILENITKRILPFVESSDGLWAWEIAILTVFILILLVLLAVLAHNIWKEREKVQKKVLYWLRALRAWSSGDSASSHG